MNQDTFQRIVEPEAHRLHALIEASDRGERHADMAEFPTRYRRLCQRLAEARHRRYSADLVARLDALVSRGHALLYRERRRDNALQRTAVALVSDFPRALRAEWRLLTIACVLFFGPLLGLTLAIHWQPSLVHSVLSAEALANIEAMYDPTSPRFLRERPAEDDLQMFGFYVRNNTGIGLRTFASGAIFCVGAALLLLFNGVMIGAVSGHLLVADMGSTFLPFVAGHGAFELPAIVIAGVAGLRLGLAIIAPGRYSRGESLRRAAHRVLILVAGFAAMFLLAAFIEAFWSSSHTIPGPFRIGVGALLWAGVLAWLGLGGRRDASR